MALKNKVLEQGVEISWWVEIVTRHPLCTYYFGEFESREQAELAQYAYIEALQQDGAQGLSIQIKKCQPPELTGFADRELVSSVAIVPASIRWRSHSAKSSEVS